VMMMMEIFPQSDQLSVWHQMPPIGLMFDQHFVTRLAAAL